MKANPCIFILTSLFLRITFVANAQSNSVIIITDSKQIPSNAKFLGKIRSGSGLKSNHSYIEAIDDIKSKALKKNANLLYIDNCSNYSSPEKPFITLTAQAYSVQNPDSLQQKLPSITDTISSKPYSYLYIYRNGKNEFPGAKNKVFQITVDSLEKYTVSQYFVMPLKILPGNHTISVENLKSPLTIKVEAGQAYYLQAKVDKSGNFVPGQVVLTLGGWSNSIKLIEDKQAAKLEYDVTAESIITKAIEN